MPVAQLYPHLQETLNAAHVASEVAYTPTLGFHLTFTAPDGTPYLAVHPDETLHGEGWDLFADGTRVLSRVTVFAVSMYLAAALGTPADDTAAGIVADYARQYPTEPPLSPKTAALAHAIWKATPTPPMGLRLAREAVSA